MTSATPQISVIIPAYNAEKWLVRAVASCLAQTQPPLEVILVDDASTDKTLAVASALAAAHPEVRVLSQAANSGPAAARNRGVAKSHGELVAFLDADDEWHPTKLQKQVAALRMEPTAGLVFTALQVKSTDGHNLRELRHRLPNSQVERVAASFVLALNMITPTLLLPRQVFEQVGGLDERLRVCEDHDLFMKIAFEHEVIYLNEPLVNRYVVPRSHSNSVDPLVMEAHYQKFLEHSLQRFPFLAPYVASFKAKVDYQVGRRYQQLSNTSMARKYFARSLAAKYSLRAVLALAIASLPAQVQHLFRENPWRRGKGLIDKHLASSHAKN